MRRMILISLLVPLVVLCTGCPPVPTDGGDGTGDVPNLDVGGNASVRDATALPLDASNEIQFSGSIAGSRDIDVFALGQLSAGDRVFIDVQQTSGNLDPVAAIFDSREYLIAFNDDREPDASNLNPQLDVVIRGDTGEYFVGIIAYPGSTTTGAYQVVVRITPDFGVPLPTQQVVYLDWQGGNNIVIPNVGAYNLPAFSATDIGLSASQTESLKDRVQAIVQARYGGLNLVVLNSDDDLRPAVAHSSVYFGGSNARAFAISEKIDTFNEDAADDTIIFTGSYIGAFSGTPTFEQMAQALGNTIAHEVGHLLGLVHTADCNDLMDSTCSNNRLLSPQEFSTAVLDTSVFPFGFQDSAEILEWLLGLVF